MSLKNIIQKQTINFSRGGDSCPECGARLTGGQEACQNIFFDMTALALSNPQYGRIRELALDTYCMQHIEPFCHSAKSYAAHLTRLCCGLERSGSPSLYAAIQHWLNGNPMLIRPEVLSKRGEMTILDTWAAENALEHERLVRSWAGNVWEAYHSQQDLARRWLEAALCSR